MKLTTKLNEIDQKLKEPVSDLYLLQVIENLCTFAFRKPVKVKKIELVSITYRVVAALFELDKKNYREGILDAKEYYYQKGMKLSDEGHNVVKFANAIEVSIIILDSDSEPWKKALKTKLLDTKTTLKRMLRKLKNKENSNHKRSSLAMTAVTRSHRHQNQHRQHAQSESMTGDTPETVVKNGF